MPGGFPLPRDYCNCNDQGTVASATGGTAVTAGNGTYGSYTQIVASTPYDTARVLVLLSTNANVNAINRQNVNVAVGPAGSEQVLLPDLVVLAPYVSWYAYCYDFPVVIPAGTRIAASAYCPGSTDKSYVSVLLFDAGFAGCEGAGGVDALGWAAGMGTSVSTGPANSYGSYTQIIASTGKDYAGVVAVLDAFGGGIKLNESVLLTIGIGPAGSEQPILSNYLFGTPESGGGGNSGAIIACSPTPFIDVSIPQGTRIAAKLQDIAGNTGYGVTLYGLYQ